jgi:hypothetical protein
LLLLHPAVAVIIKPRIISIFALVQLSFDMLR